MLPWKIRLLWWGTNIYNHFLGNQIPIRVKSFPKIPPFFTQAIFFADNSDGLFFSSNPEKTSQKNWPLTDDPYARSLQSFRWLTLNPCREASLNLDTTVQEVFTNWTDLWERWHPFIWRSDLLGERLGYWLNMHQEICRNGDKNFRNIFYISMLRQAKHLHFATLENPSSWKCFLAHWGRIYTSFAFSELKSRRKQSIKNFEIAIQDQILPDGGHTSRNPSVALALFAILINTRDILIFFQEKLPEGLISGIDRLGPFVKALRHSDGKFALYGGSIEGNSALIEEILTASKTNPNAIANARHSGFSRLRAGQTTVIFDTGSSAIPSKWDTQISSTLAFELSNGNSRLVCNCGNRISKKTTGWNAALGSSAAFSTITLADKNIGSIFKFIHERNDQKGARLVEATHDGYNIKFGVNITRTLYLSSNGHDFRGEDKIIGTSNASFTIRFHIHPDVKIYLVETKKRAILKPLNGNNWQFDCQWPLSVEESVYFGNGHLRRTLMITINGNLDGNQTLVKWRFSTLT